MTRHAAMLAADEVKALDAELDFIDPVGIEISYLGQKFAEPFAGELKKRVATADGIIFATPEYNGTFSAVLTAIIENLDYPVVFSGKPVALLGVAAGAIGAIKSLEHLRSVCSHSGALVLPGEVSIAQVYKYFNEQGQCKDVKIEELVRQVPRSLVQYIEQRI